MRFLSYTVFFVTSKGRTARPIWTNEGPKRVVPRKDILLGSERCSSNFGVKPLKPENLGVLMGLSSLNDKKLRCYNLKTRKLIVTKFLQQVPTTNEPSYVGSPTAGGGSAGLIRPWPPLKFCILGPHTHYSESPTLDNHSSKSKYVNISTRRLTFSSCCSTSVV